MLAPFTFLSFAPNFLLYIRVFEPSGEVFFEKDVFFEDKKKKRSETFQKQQENVSKKRFYLRINLVWESSSLTKTPSEQRVVLLKSPKKLT